MPVATMDRPPKSELTGAKDNWWEPRIWTGITVGAWLRLLAAHGFRISPSRIPMASAMTLWATISSGLSTGQWLLYGRRIRETEITKPPLFIVGHWRSGTTLLHEYVVLDPQFTFPTTYDCFGPRSFLFSRRLVEWWLKFFMPRSRPMDNMAVGLSRPQEDEFAFANAGLPSPYLDWAFPNHRRVCPEYRDLRSLSPEDLAAWKHGFLYFLKTLTAREDKTIVLKSPTHTFRVRTLIEMFPEARFIHITRDPYVVFPSTCNAWRRMWKVHGLQAPNFDGLEEYVFEDLELMYRVFEEDRANVPAGQLMDVKYEDLVADPVGKLAEIYQRLELGDFGAVRGRLEAFVTQGKDYKKNRFLLEPEIEQQIRERWGFFCERYGYDT